MNYLLTKAQTAVTSHFRLALAPYDITPVQCGVLNSLYNEDGLGLKSLCDILAINASTMTGVVDRMESRGLVERRPDPTDRRALAIFLTEKGRSLEDVTAQLIQESNAFALQGFSEEQAAALREMLIELGDLASIQQQQQQPQPQQIQQTAR